MLTKIFPILSKYIQVNDSLIVGVSGGPDSVFLLNILAEFSKQMPCKIIIAHVNHGIRGREADKDEKFVKNLAEKFGHKFEAKRVKLAGKSAVEENGRKIRREFFEMLLQKYHAHSIITAHTQDDNVETIIFNFLRGSGLKGLAGMKEKNGFYLKPLLGTGKPEILKFLHRRKIKFCKDKTNDDTRFSRNFIRKKILPLFSKINPSFCAAILRSSSIFRELDDFITLQARQFLKKHRKGSSLFPLKEYESLPEALKTAVIREAFRICKKTAYSLSAIKTAEIRCLLGRKIGNKKIICSKGGGFYLKKGMVKWLWPVHRP
ncbi:tRNA lysidine(34) synthetase TilS [Candidatus Peregrinibacteria bacterium]|nr:tRNA lysidine(34) synthetase TilS [Candidatus Peregrinibacteria bacterium]